MHHSLPLHWDSHSRAEAAATSCKVRNIGLERQAHHNGWVWVGCEYRARAHLLPRKGAASTFNHCVSYPIRCPVVWRSLNCRHFGGTPHTTDWHLCVFSMDPGVQLLGAVPS